MGYQSNGHPMPGVLELEEVEQQAKQYAHNIFTHKTALLEILERYEVKLRERWIKKTRKLRRKVLLAAFPKMPAEHRPDFEVLRREGLESTRLGTDFRDAFLLPSLNQEDLLDAKHLLLFLASRGRNDPEVFVNSDWDSIRLRFKTHAISPPYLCSHTMLLSGQNTESTYGSLLSWKDEVGAENMISNGTGFRPGEGLVVLEIQQRKLSFLLNCARQILQGLQLQDLSIPKQPCPPKVVVGNESLEWPSLMREIVEAPYRLPDKYNTSRLLSYLSAKRDEAQDHFWLVREDPSYFKDTIMDRAEHSQEKILMANGKSHPVVWSDVFWERVLDNIVIEAYASMACWSMLGLHVENLARLEKERLNQTEIDAESPEDYEHTLCHFVYFIERMTRSALEAWKNRVPASPPLRKHYYMEPSEDWRIGEVDNFFWVLPKESAFQQKDHVLSLMEQLREDKIVLVCGLDNLTDELERKLRSDSKSQHRLSSWLAKSLSDLSLLGEIKRQIGSFKAGTPITEIVPLAHQKDTFKMKMSTYAEVVGPGFKGMKLAAVGTPLGKFTYPSHERRTAATTKEMQDAEANLDLFWQQVDDYFIQNLGRPLNELAGVSEKRSPRRTQDWVEPALDVKSPLPDAQSIMDRFSAIDLERRTEETIAVDAPPAVRQEEKTRGTTSKSFPKPAQEPPATTESPKLPVSKRDFKVFSTLFHDPTERYDPPGEIPWSDFLLAMTSIGFSVKKLAGSAWIFVPVDDVFQKSIIFHEPHPSRKIPFHVAMRYGRRLEWAYGLSGNSFVQDVRS